MQNTEYLIKYPKNVYENRVRLLFPYLILGKEINQELTLIEPVEFLKNFKETKRPELLPIYLNIVFGRNCHKIFEEKDIENFFLKYVGEKQFSFNTTQEYYVTKTKSELISFVFVNEFIPTEENFSSLENKINYAKKYFGSRLEDSKLNDLFLMFAPFELTNYYNIQINQFLEKGIIDENIDPIIIVKILNRYESLRHITSSEIKYLLKLMDEKSFQPEKFIFQDFGLDFDLVRLIFPYLILGEEIIIEKKGQSTQDIKKIDSISFSKHLWDCMKIKYPILLAVYLYFIAMDISEKSKIYPDDEKGQIRTIFKWLFKAKLNNTKNILLSYVCARYFMVENIEKEDFENLIKNKIFENFGRLLIANVYLKRYEEINDGKYDSSLKFLSLANIKTETKEKLKYLEKVVEFGGNDFFGDLASYELGKYYQTKIRELFENGIINEELRTHGKTMCEYYRKLSNKSIEFDPEFLEKYLLGQNAIIMFEFIVNRRIDLVALYETDKYLFATKFEEIERFQGYIFAKWFISRNEKVKILISNKPLCEYIKWHENIKSKTFNEEVNLFRSAYQNILENFWLPDEECVKIAKQFKEEIETIDKNCEEIAKFFRDAGQIEKKQISENYSEIFSKMPEKIYEDLVKKYLNEKKIFLDVREKRNIETGKFIEENKHLCSGMSDERFEFYLRLLRENKYDLSTLCFFRADCESDKKITEHTKNILGETRDDERIRDIFKIE